MIIEIGENDIRNAVTPDQRAVLEHPEASETLGIEERLERLVKVAIPQILAQIGNRMKPEGFEMKEISIEGKLVGRPFNVGLESGFTIVFRRS